MELLTVIFWSTIGSLVSLIGGIFLVNNARFRAKATNYGLPFGAGALLAVAFLSALPEAIEGGDAHQMLTFTLAGLLGFFLLERLLGWFHSHSQHDHNGDNKANSTKQSLVIVGDTLHNAIDGVAIGAAFLVNPAAGIGTAIAVTAHELPQEISDFGILLGRGMRARNVVLVNLLSALATVFTAVGTFSLGAAIEINPAPLLAVAAGFFIYIAASDIIPEIHERPRREANQQAAILFVGAAMIAAVIWLIPHSHQQQDCLPQATLNTMGSPAPGTSLPPACEAIDEHDH